MTATTLRVVVDGRPLVGNRTGIGVHTAEIARRLDFDPPPLIASHAEIEDRSGLENLRFAVDRYPLGVLWQQLAMAKHEADVFWGPHGTLPITLKKPAVVSLHDFTSITMPGRHLLKTVLSFNTFIGRSLEIANRVAAVSRLVADEAMRGFGVPASKIEIVPNGVDPFFSPGDAEGDYILYVGTREPRKGLGQLIHVWNRLGPDHPPLVLVGSRGWKTKLPPNRLIKPIDYVSREQLRDLYRRALVFVYPSLYEGFGIPPLEAMACGAPVIATRTGAIPDYAGDAAMIVTPGDEAELHDALTRVLSDRGLRDELRARGPERARRYSWDESARRMTALLVEAAR